MGDNSKIVETLKTIEKTHQPNSGDNSMGDKGKLVKTIEKTQKQNIAEHRRQ